MKNQAMKKVFIVLIALLLVFDVTLIFAAQVGNDAGTQRALQQIQELQKIQQSQMQTIDKNRQSQQQIFQAFQSAQKAGDLSGFGDQDSTQQTAATFKSSQSSSVKSAATPLQTLTSQISDKQVKAQVEVHKGLAQSKLFSDFKTPYPTQASSETESQQILSNAAFGSVAQTILPLSPNQIHRLKQIYSNSQFAAAAPAGIPPKPVMTSLNVGLDPGSTPPVVRLAANFATSVVFLDSTGAPWPVKDYVMANSSAFNVQWDGKSHSMVIQPSSLFTYGNIILRLRGLDTPISLNLIPGQQVVDYRVDMHIPGIGPNPNALPLEDDGASPANSRLLSILNAIPPPGSTPLTLSHHIGQAWVAGENIYIRTRHTILSPGWIAMISSADGMKAYEMTRTPSLLVAKNGKPVQVKIEGL